MKHVKMFETFNLVNEAKGDIVVDKNLAKLTLDLLINNGSLFREIIYLSLYDREQIKSKYANRFPNGFAGPEKGMLASYVLEPLVGDDVYIDGEDLVKGDKTVMVLNSKTTWKDVAKVLNIKL